MSTSTIPAISPTPAMHLSRLTGVQILACGSYSPPTIVRNEDLAALGCDPEWIIQRTGIRERRRASPSQATSDLAKEAALACLEKAGVLPSEIDLIVLATMSPDSPAPSTACRLQGLIGATCPAMDVSAACAGFMFALVTGMQFVKTGCAKKVLVVGAETMTRTVNPADKKTYPLFGDGAGAVLLTAGSESQGLLAYQLGSDASGCELLHIPGGGTREPLTPESIAAGRQFMHMDGRAVFKWAVNQISKSVRLVLEEAQLQPADLDLVVLHQANRRILDAAVEALGLSPEKIAINLDRFGNTSAASIPLVLDELARSGRLRPGSRVLFSGFGAGLAWGTGVFQW